MLPIDSATGISKIQDSYLDPNSLNSVKAMGRDKDPQALKEIAKKFEAMFVQQMLKTMREANESFSEGNYFDSQTTRFHRDMLDQQMVLNLTSGQGIGLADHFYQQMLKNYGTAMKPGDESPAVETTGQLAQAVTYHAALPPYLNKVNTMAVRTGQKTGITQGQENFVQLLKPHAEKAAAELNINPDVLIAQVALETGWGKQVIHDNQGNNSFNLFNIKAGPGWQGEKVNLPTLEYRNGIAASEKADFRKYNDYAESFSDYVNLMKNNARYGEVLAAGSDSKKYAEALQAAGYATDPEYAKKIKRLLNNDAIKSLGNLTDAMLSTFNRAATAGRTLVE